MSQETIQVGYLSLGTVPSAGTYHHKYIIYTDKDGNQWATRGGPSGGSSGSGSSQSTGQASSATGDLGGSGSSIGTGGGSSSNGSSTQGGFGGFGKLTTESDLNGNIVVPYDENFIDHPDNGSNTGLMKQ